LPDALLYGTVRLNTQGRFCFATNPEERVSFRPEHGANTRLNMLELLTSMDAWIAFFTLTALELVLGIDNIIFM
jgi:hypothetical protein